MSSYKLIIVGVPHNKADMISSIAMESGSPGGTILIGHGLSSSKVAAVFGLGETIQDELLFLSEDEKSNVIYENIKKVCEEEKPAFGFIYKMDANSFLKTGSIQGEEKGVSMAFTHELITVILNKGYAEDAMAAARKAGAGGGTVLNARGTAREDDAKFFGMHIVPEKEMLMIVVEAEKKQIVLDAIKNLPCLQESGSGIAFCTGVESFEILGAKKKN